MTHGPVGEALERSIADAADRLTVMDDGLLQAARYLAKKIDTEDAFRDRILHASAEAETEVKAPPMDNVSVPTFLKYMESLGLSPSARHRIDGPKKEGATGGGKRGKLSVLRGEEGKSA